MLPTYSPLIHYITIHWSVPLSGHFTRRRCLVFGSSIKRSQQGLKTYWMQRCYRNPTAPIWGRIPDVHFLYWFNHLRSLRVQSIEGAKRNLSILFIDDRQCIYMFFTRVFLKIMCTGRMTALCNMALCIIRLYSLITAASISKPKLEDWNFGNKLPDHRISHDRIPQAGNKLQGHRIS